jgi:hypothetical protein
MDVFLNGLIQNERVGTTAIEYLNKYKETRFFFFIHFDEPDHVGHQYGENSQEYSDGIRSDDDWTGRIIAELKRLSLYDETLVYVTADHGFDEGKTTHSNAREVLLASNDPKIIRDGDRADITPTILKRFGVDLSEVSPVLDGVPLDEPMPARPSSPVAFISLSSQMTLIMIHAADQPRTSWVPSIEFNWVSDESVGSMAEKFGCCWTDS